MKKIDDSLPIQLLKLREMLMEHFRLHLNEEGITDQQWRVLRVLNEQQTCDLKTLSHHSIISQSSLSRIIKRMEDYGIVRMSRDADDGRAINVELSDKGQLLFGKMAKRSDVIRSEIEKILGEKNIELLLVDLKKMQKKFAAPKNRKNH